MLFCLFAIRSALISKNICFTDYDNFKKKAFVFRAGIPAVNENGDLLLLYVGIIDILQNYRLRKKLEHALKSTLVTRVCC